MLQSKAKRISWKWRGADVTAPAGKLPAPESCLHLCVAVLGDTPLSELRKELGAGPQARFSEADTVAHARLPSFMVELVMMVLKGVN